VVRHAAATPFFVIVAGLMVVGLLGWVRTRATRRGVVPKGRDPPATAGTTSRATYLAALAGLAAMAWGATVVEGNRIGGAMLFAAGLFITVAGSVARVTGFRADGGGLVILFARGRSFRASWSELSTLRVPSTPLGGWRLADVRGTTTTLMPSDLFGHEQLLETIIVRSDLRFDGRTWSREARSRPEGSGRSELSPRRP
jgi:hypothetical protein